MQVHVPHTEGDPGEIHVADLEPIRTAQKRNGNDEPEASNYLVGLSHVLDTTFGKPAAGVQVSLYAVDPADDNFTKTGYAETDSDGRILKWTLTQGAFHESSTNVYKLVFEVEEYYKKLGTETFFPWVEIFVNAKDLYQEHYHVPLLLSPYSYSTYRGS